MATRSPNRSRGRSRNRAPSLDRRERSFHDEWMGQVQPSEGLLLSIPTLVDAQIAQPASPAQRAAFTAQLVSTEDAASPGDDGETIESGPRIADHAAFFGDFLGWRDLLVGDPETGWTGPPLPDDLELYVPEGRQLLRPTLALRDPFYRGADSPYPADRGPAPDSPASRAGAGLTMLVWTPEALVAGGLDLDKPESQTGEWHYPPVRKLERLLRHCRVPLGVIGNGRELRLVYAPHGESPGSISFRVEHMAAAGGQRIVDALCMLLRADALFSDPDNALPALARRSRDRQADVTEELARQVYEALETLLVGFETAATRGGPSALAVLAEAMGEDTSGGDDDGAAHLYGGLLSVLLRLVFLLYAEDNGVMPTEHPLYQSHLSVLGLYAQLRDDAGAYPESMDRRFGAWPRLLALFRAVHRGLCHGDLQMPPRRGRLFDPEAFPFLEGRRRGAPADAIELSTPRIDDATVHAVLEGLLVLEGQRLSYRALDVEQIGSVYERLMGYRVERLGAESVRIKGGDTGVWVSAAELRALPANRRAKWLEDERGVDKRVAKEIADAVAAAEEAHGTTTVGAAILEAMTDALASFAAVEVDARRPAGRLVLQPGKERIRTSSHYTPRSLSEPIVRRTLEPILATLGEAPTAEQILALKVCDPAMGSGAFLVEACRFLADRVVAAWARGDELVEIGEQVDDPTVHARRLVAQRCLYGVDKNAFAVDLARISLWLVTLAKDEPFTFVDHALRHGDSLVGFDLDAIRRFDWDAERSINYDAFRDGLDRAVSEALEKREAILALASEEGAGFARTKEELLEDAEHAMTVPRLVGDCLVGAWFAHDKERAKDDERKRRLTVIAEWLSHDAPGVRVPPQVQSWANEIRQRLPVFHWPLEFPEVFHERRADPLDAGRINNVAKMDAFVGNPPFAGKNAITESNGEGYIKWLQALHADSHGNADLSAHFFRRAAALLGAHGTIGLIATNTISQGDTRSSGLQWLIQRGHRIYAAERSKPWPGKAAVTVDIVHLAIGHPLEHLSGAELDGIVVEQINSRLRPTPERGDPVKLRANASRGFQGTIVLGMGFTLTPEEREALLDRDERNGERVFPYLGGQELNSHPRQEHDRYVISFGDMTLEQAEAWPDLIARVRELVKPERERSSHSTASWWHFERPRLELYRALRPLDRCLACARVSKHLIIAWQPTDRIFSEQLNVFPLDGDAHLGLLQSRPHEVWARLLSSSMKTDTRYSVSDCFETFPFPPDDALNVGSALDRTGTALHEARAAYCIERDQGLTATYNDLKDPDNTDPAVEHLRALHLAVDRAVIEAYGWAEVPVPRHLFPRPGTDEAKETMPLIEAIPAYTTPRDDAEQRAFERFEDAVLDKLFALNAERAAQEKQTALRAATTKPAKPKAKKKAKGEQGEMDL